MSRDFNAALPKKDGGICDKLNEFTYLIHGEPGIGKSTFAQQFPDSFFLFFEPGGRTIHHRKKFIPDWSDALKVLKQLEKNPGYCQTVIIDTGYKAYEKCLHWSMADMGLTEPGDEDWGKAWTYIEKNFIEFHYRLLAAGYSYLTIAHSEYMVIKKRNKPEVHKIKTMLGKQAWRYYWTDADLVGYYELNADGERVLQIRENPDVEVKCRIDNHFLYSGTNKIIKEIPMGKNKFEAFNNFEAAFNNCLSKKGEIGKKERRKKLPFKIK